MIFVFHCGSSNLGVCLFHITSVQWEISGHNWTGKDWVSHSKEG